MHLVHLERSRLMLAWSSTATGLPEAASPPASTSVWSCSPNSAETRRRSSRNWRWNMTRLPHSCREAQKPPIPRPFGKRWNSWLHTRRNRPGGVNPKWRAEGLYDLSSSSCIQPARCATANHHRWHIHSRILTYSGAESQEFQCDHVGRGGSRLSERRIRGLGICVRRRDNVLCF